MEERRGGIAQKTTHLPNMSLLEPFAVTIFFKEHSKDCECETCFKRLTQKQSNVLHVFCVISSRRSAILYHSNILNSYEIYPKKSVMIIIKVLKVENNLFLKNQDQFKIIARAIFPNFHNSSNYQNFLFNCIFLIAYLNYYVLQDISLLLFTEISFFKPFDLHLFIEEPFCHYCK